VTAGHGPWPTAVAWYERFRKALATVLAVAAVPGVLGVLDLIGVHISAGVWATVVSIATVIIGGSATALVPNTLSQSDVQKAAAKVGLVVQKPPM
jgi:putative effector of murein hydrolase LrgA (UPF0299 family)